MNTIEEIQDERTAFFMMSADEQAKYMLARDIEQNADMESYFENVAQNLLAKQAKTEKPLFEQMTETIFWRIVGMYEAGAFTVEMSDKAEELVQKVFFSFGGMSVRVYRTKGLGVETNRVLVRSKSGKFNADYELNHKRDISRIETSIFGGKQ